MTHQEMIDQVSDELRNTNITTKITRWLNMSIIELATLYMFGHLNKYANKSTAVGNPDITLDDDFLWLENIQIPVDVIKLYPIDESYLAGSVPNYRVLPGYPYNYYINGLQLGIYQVPSSVKIITYNYYRRPAKLLSDLSVNCDLPEEWHSVVTQKATTKGYDYDGQSEGAIKSQAVEKRLLRQIGAHAYLRPDAPVVMGINSTPATRLPSPQFPSHYPAVRR